MSKIEVDAIDKQSGSTLTLGGSGTAVTLAAGATQSGFGREGSVNWQTGSIKTATFTAVSGEGYFVNTTGGVITANLPAGVAGAIVSFADYAATFQTNALTVSPNGTDKIGSENEVATLSTEGQSVTFVFVDSTQGWINTMDSTSNVRGQNPFVEATVSGACNTLTVVDTNFKLATFTGPGTFTVTSSGSCAGSNTVDYMVIAGGGSGGMRGGGGGAGGFRESPGTASGSYSVSPLGASPAVALAVPVQAYPITVGGGGAPVGPSPNAPGNKGSNSVFSTITSTGGGFGGGYGLPPTRLGGPGGSGGGSPSNDNGSPSTPSVTLNYYGTGNTPPVSPPQGQNGGSGTNAWYYSGGGGGGAGAVGGNGGGGPGQPSSVGGPGGAGVTTSISGSAIQRAGGGGANGIETAGTGGAGGGGNGSKNATGTAGTANTGGGGGGTQQAPSNSGAGGSGVVMIRYRFQ